ncbi:MAG: endonuclease/exonuclease/phosphatase family protein, partial [Bdellovibrionota bacterium]
NSPDVIMLQEAWNFGSDASVGMTLSRDLGYDMIHRLDMGAPGVLYDSDVILAKKELHLSGTEDFVLPHSAGFVGDAKTWIIVTGAVTAAVGGVVHLADGTPVYVYTSHLVGNPDPQRFDQLMELERRIKAHVAADHGDWSTARVLIGGDLNSDPTLPSIKAMFADGFVSTYDQVHPELSGTEAVVTNCGEPTSPYYDPIVIGAGQYPPQNDANSANCEQIDFVLLRGAGKTLASTLIFTAPVDKIWMSDHYGVFSTIAFDGVQPSPPLPNPERDSPILPPTALLSISPRVLACEFDDGCSKLLADLNAHEPKGFTVRNDVAINLRIQVYGPGRIMSYSSVDLKPGEISGFAFTEPGDFRYRITDEQHDDIEGIVHVAP